jgi:hypothetical protein
LLKKLSLYKGESDFGWGIFFLGEDADYRRQFVKEKKTWA